MKSAFIAQQIRDYLSAHSTQPDEIFRDLAVETRGLGPAAEMRIPAEQGAFLTVLTAAAAPQRAIEIGTFTGSSALCIARGLPAGGRLLCLDVSAEWTAVARRYWERAGLSDRIDLILGPAVESLANLPEEPTFKLAFIDADKTSYQTYYELLLPRMTVDGLIIIDNVLQSGRVLQPDTDNLAAIAVRDLNRKLATDSRVQVVMLPVADGLTIARKLPAA